MATKVPHWNKVFRQYGFSDIRNLEDLKKLPILTREEIKQIPIDRLIRSDIQKSNFVENFTSGSTGEPLRFYQDRDELATRRALVFEELRSIGCIEITSALIIGLDTHKYLDTIGFRFDGNKLTSRDERVNTLYIWIRENRPTVLISTPGFIRQLADAITQDGENITFKTVLFRGERMHEHERAYLEESLQAKLFSSYGTRECSMIALQCQWGNNHLLPWVNCVEIVPDSYSATESGGRLVVTHFENEVMPFIRYDIGDRGRMSLEPCPCGRTTPTIEFAGRAPGMVELTSGRQVATLGISTNIAMRFHGEITRFQMEQANASSFIFRFIPTASYSNATEATLLKYFHEVFQDELKCVLEKVNDILPNESGKTPIFIKRI